MESSTYKVFISYKRKTGEDFALHLKEGLVGEQISAFLDIEDIPRKLLGMSEWWKFRDKAISQSEIFLLIITDGIENSSEVIKELTYANENNIHCIFFRHKGLQPKIILNLSQREVNLGDLNQTEFETKEDLLRKALRILRETSRADSLQEKAIPVNSAVLAGKQDIIEGIMAKLSEKAVSTEDIVGQLEDHEVDFLRGRWFFKKKDYDKALTLFDRSLAFKPDFVPCLIEKSVVLESLERHEESIAWLDKAIELDPSSFLTYALKGTAFNSLKKYEQAIENYDKSLELKPTEHIYYNKGVALEKLGRYSEAITCYEKAIEMNPKDWSYWHNKAFVLLELKRYDESIASCDKALEIASTASSWGLKGIALMSIGKMAEAKTCYGQALKIETIPIILIYLSQVLLIVRDTQEGLATAERAFCLSKRAVDRASSWVLRIVAHLILGNSERARTETSKLLAFLRLEKDASIGNDIQLLIRPLEETLTKEEKESLSSLVSLLRKETKLEDFDKQ